MRLGNPFGPKASEPEPPISSEIDYRRFKTYEWLFPESAKYALYRMLWDVTDQQSEARSIRGEDTLKWSGSYHRGRALHRIGSFAPDAKPLEDLLNALSVFHVGSWGEGLFAYAARPGSGAESGLIVTLEQYEAEPSSLLVPAEVLKSAKRVSIPWMAGTPSMYDLYAETAKIAPKYGLTGTLRAGREREIAFVRPLA